MHPMTSQTAEKSEWYSDGLQFSCTQCGNCCTGPPGYVWFTEAELDAMAAFAHITPEQFRDLHTHRVGRRWTLNERKVDGKYDCIFLKRDDEGKALCGIYAVRPMQCRTWPFWPDNLRSQRAWDKGARGCPGMARGKQGEGDFYPVEHIRIQRDNTPS